MYRILLLVPFLLLSVIGCDLVSGDEVARFPINRVSSGEGNGASEQSLQLQKGEQVAFWSEMELEYEGEVDLRFRVNIMKDGTDFDQLEVNPFEKNITIGEVKKEINGDVYWSFEGKNGEIEIPEDGKYTFHAWLEASDTSSLKVGKAELVLRK